MNNGVVYQMPEPLEKRARLVIYVDSTECATCRISHLDMYHPLFHLSERKKSLRAGTQEERCSEYKTGRVPSFAECVGRGNLGDACD